MRITLLNQFYRPDIAPTAHLSASLAEHLAGRGNTVTVIAGKGAYVAKDAAGGDSTSDNPRVRRVWTPGLGKSSHLKRLIDYAFFYIFAAFKLLTLPRQDVIITLTTPPLISWCALLHKRLHGRKTRLVLWNMDCYPDVAERAGVMKPVGLTARFCHARNRAVFRGLDHLICLDEAMASLLAGNYAAAKPDLPVTIIPNFEDASFFPVNAEHAPWGGAGKLDLDGKFVVLYLGNMGYGHDFETVLNAARALKDEPVRFLFIGSGRHWQAVKDRAAQEGLTNIIMHGYIPKEQTGGAMSIADCALVTLRDDALGIMSPSKIHSNLAMGLPLIYVGPRRSNVDEAIGRFGCGISLRHGQDASLVDFVRSMMSVNARRAELKRCAREAFDTAYCDTAVMPRFEAVIEHSIRARAATSLNVPAGPLRAYAGILDQAAAPLPEAVAP
jgi:colanic acid biosynthesis glycosyl transferase WcaI